MIWEKPLEIENLDPDSAEFEFILPPKTVLRFGVLSNDNYVSHDQEFMNGRVFNLKKMTVQKGESEPEVITKSSFDNYFVKDDGEIRYTVK